jgi:hypothetical protein
VNILDLLRDSKYDIKVNPPEDPDEKKHRLHKDKIFFIFSLFIVGISILFLSYFAVYGEQVIAQWSRTILSGYAGAFGGFLVGKKS